MQVAPTVKVRLTPEEKNAVQNWEEQVAIFQRQCDERTKDKRERFRLCLHEGGHAQQDRRLGWDVEFHGPYVYFDREERELSFVNGAVSPIRTNNYEPFHWQHAMVSIAGFTWVEHFTAWPNDPHAIQNDLRTLRAKLVENEDLNEAVYYAKIVLSEDLRIDPAFLPELEQAVRDYEVAVYGTDEATRWGWREYRFELPGTRHRVIVPYSGTYGLLVEHNGDLELVVEGKVLRPTDELRGVRQEVRIAEPEKSGTHRAVRRWNDAVPEATKISCS
jgi:hypothetical protein